MDDDNHNIALPMLGHQLLAPHVHWQLGAPQPPMMPEVDQTMMPIPVLPGQPGQLLGQPGQLPVLGEPVNPIVLPGQPGQLHGQPGQLLVLGEHVNPVMLPGQPGQLHGQPGQLPVLGEPVNPIVLPGQPGQLHGQPGQLPVLGEPVNSIMFPGLPGQLPVLGEPVNPIVLPGQPGHLHGQPGQLPVVGEHVNPAMLPGQPGQLHVLGEPVNTMVLPGQPGQLHGQPGQLPVLGEHVNPAMLPGQPGQLPVLGEPVNTMVLPGQPGQLHGQPGQLPVLGGPVDQIMLLGQPGQLPVLGEPVNPIVMPGQPGQLPGQPGQLPVVGEPVNPIMVHGQPGQLPGQPVLPGQPGQLPVVGEPVNPIVVPGQPSNILGASMTNSASSPVLPGPLSQPMMHVLPGYPGQQQVGESIVALPGFVEPSAALPGHLGQQQVLGAPMVDPAASPVLHGHHGQEPLSANLIVPEPVSLGPLPGLVGPSHVVHGEIGQLSMIGTHHLQPAMMHAMPSAVEPHTMPGFLPQPVPPPALRAELLEVHQLFQDNQIACMHSADQACTVPVEGQLANVPVEAQAVAVSQPVQDAALVPAPVFRHIVRPSEDDSLPVQTAVVRPHQDVLLSAQVANEPDKHGHFVVEWDWVRAANAIGLKSAKEHKYLQRNRELHQQELIAAAIPQAEIMYKGNGSIAGTKGHCMNSAAFMLLILLVSSIKQLNASVKQNALSIVCGLLQIGCKVLASELDCLGTIYAKGHGYISQTLVVDSTGVIQGLFQLIQKHPGATWAWVHLMKAGVTPIAISSSCQLPTIWDLVLFLIWAKNNSSTKKVWQHVGQLLWPNIMWLCGKILDTLALERSRKPLEQLPLLKTNKGKSKRVPWQNKVILLRKLRQTKQHRKNTMESHGDLVPKGIQLVSAEDRLTAALYASKVKQAYQEAYHYSVHWDPSNYDIETLVSIIFSTQAGDEGSEGLAAYLPIQNMKPVAKKEVSPEIQALGAKKKLTRIEGFNELRALSHSLMGVGMPLEKFFLEGVCWKKLEEFESRVFENGLWWIVNARTGSKKVQLPQNFNIAKTPLLVSLSDQGGINRSGLDYLTSKLGMTLHVSFDPYHRSWNDVKLSLKASKGDLFKCLLSYSLLYNINYGPFGSKAWHEKKLQRVTELLEAGSAHREPFLSFIPWICLERQIPEPRDAQERQKLFESLADMNSIKTLGPVVKLMRFFFHFSSQIVFTVEKFGAPN